MTPTGVVGTIGNNRSNGQVCEIHSCQKGSECSWHAVMSGFTYREQSKGVIPKRSNET